MVVADLPPECFISSKMTNETLVTKGIGSAGTNVNCTTPSDDESLVEITNKKKKRSHKKTDDKSALINVIKETTELQKEVAKQKLSFFENEDACRDQKNRKFDLNEWQQMQENIRMLRNDLTLAGIRPEDKADIANDIDILVEKKNELSKKLGL